jgi:DNA (cytosine-5)-methyltransferase 1
MRVRRQRPRLRGAADHLHRVTRDSVVYAGTDRSCKPGAYVCATVDRHHAGIRSRVDLTHERSGSRVQGREPVHASDEGGVMLALPARVPLNYASLFSGIGGFDIGFDRAGMRCIAQAEWDQHASEVLKHHWPNVTHLKDVRDVTRDSFRSIDVLCGGFPCQDVSVAGKRAGLDGERSGLWFEFYRIIKEHTPRWVVIENVPGLLTSNRGRDFAVIIDGLVKCGYGVCWRVLDAQYFGLAQRRKRVFIVASFGDGRCTEVLFEREGSTGDSKPSRTQGQGATTYAIKGAAIGRQPHNGPQYGEINGDGTSYTLNTSEVHAVAGTLPASGAGTAQTGNERNEVSLLIPVIASTIQRGEGQAKERG